MLSIPIVGGATVAVDIGQQTRKFSHGWGTIDVLDMK